MHRLRLPTLNPSPGRFGSIRHLAGRFADSFHGPPPPEDEAWAVARLLPGESPLWRRMSAADRRHAITVARRCADLLGGEANTPRPVVAAALLHDAGKVESGLGTTGRVWATVVGMAGGRGRGRVWRYLHHDELGARLLVDAGSDPLTVDWARQHHLPPARWSVPAPLGDALKAADSD